MAGFEIRFMDMESYAKALEYRVAEHISEYVAEWARHLGDFRSTISIKWVADPTAMSKRMEVHIGNWRTTKFVDPALFDHVKKDTAYLEYLRSQITRAAENGVIMQWLDSIMSGIDEEGVYNMWVKSLGPQIEYARFASKVDHSSSAHGPTKIDLVQIILKDNAVPITMTVEEVIKSPKTLLAHIGIMK